MGRKPLLTYSTGSVDQGLLRRNEYLAVETHLLHTQLQSRIRLTDGEQYKGLPVLIHERMITPDVPGENLLGEDLRRVDSGAGMQYPGTREVPIVYRPMTGGLP
jgi:hypothetical protein